MHPFVSISFSSPAPPLYLSCSPNPHAHSCPQLGRDGDADAQVLSLRAIATELPIAGETTKVPHAKPPAVLADVVLP